MMMQRWLKDYFDVSFITELHEFYLFVASYI